MVESNQQDPNPDSGSSQPIESSEQTPATNQPAGSGEEGDTGWGTEPAPPLDAEGQKSLAAFLEKVSGACQKDNSVPSFVGDQVNEWLKEMQAEGITAEAETGQA